MRIFKYFPLSIAVFISYFTVCISSPHGQSQVQTAFISDENYIPTTRVSILNDDTDGESSPDATTLVAESRYDPEIADDAVTTENSGLNDDVSTATTQVNDEFPTPLPFLSEPEIEGIRASDYSGKGSVVSTNSILHEKLGVTIKTFNGTNYSYYAGRAACECGRPGIRIVNGEDAKINEYPWTVVLYRRSFFFGKLQQYCGGTLINNRYIVTASHCVDGMIPPSIEVGVHDENIASEDELENKSQMFKVETIIMHPDYNRRTVDNDIALLRLSTPAELNQIVVPACLPANNDFSFEGVTATAAGWGATEEGGSTSKVLRKVDVPIISNEVCNTQTKYNGKITENMLCAGDIEKGQKDACQGDSGGPLVIENGGRRTLVGVVSWGYGCARPMSPGVYTRVGRYPEFIIQNVESADWCGA